jgi:hypothetical protein
MKIEYLKDIPYETREDIHYKLTLENYEKDGVVF